MITVEVKGVDKLVKDLQELGAQRIPNHVSRAINEVANAAQKAMIFETTSNLTTRNNWFKPGTRYGINRKASTKNTLEATVSSVAPWLAAQEGGEMFKTARKSNFLAVPMGTIRANRQDPRKVPRYWLPKNLGTKLFPINTKHGIVLYQRMRNGVLRAMYALERVVRGRRESPSSPPGSRRQRRRCRRRWSTRSPMRYASKG